MHRVRVLCLGISLASVGVTQSPTTSAGRHQAPVLPWSHANREGSGATNIPFGRSVPVRVQLAYDRSILSGALQIGSLAFRPDRGFSAAPKQVRLQVHLGTLAGDATALVGEFARNRGADYTDVFGSRSLSLPGKQAMPALPFPVTVPLVRSFAYDPRRGSLLMELAVQQQPAGSYRLDSTYTCQSPVQYYGPKGCGPANGPVLALESLTTTPTWNNPLVLRVTGAKPRALTLLFFGLQNSGSWRGIPLPFDGGLIGAPGCSLSTSVLWSPRRLADAQGRAQFGTYIPPIVRLQNASVYVQGVAEDPTANPLGVVTSQAARITLCGFEPVARVFANGLQTTAGVRELGVAPIVRLATR